MVLHPLMFASHFAVFGDFLDRAFGTAVDVFIYCQYGDYAIG